MINRIKIHVWSEFQPIWIIFGHFIVTLRPILGHFPLYIKYGKIAIFYQTSTYIWVYKSRRVNFSTLRTLIFARHLFSRVHIFAAYIFAPEALGINFRYVSIFAWWLFSFFSPENPLEVIFAPVYMLINIVRNLTCWHSYILNGRHYFHVLLFSRVLIFAFFLGAKITTARKLMSLR